MRDGGLHILDQVQVPFGAMAGADEAEGAQDAGETAEDGWLAVPVVPVGGLVFECVLRGGSSH